MNWPVSSTSLKAASSLGISGPYSARTSTSGIVCTTIHFSPSAPSVDQIRRTSDDGGHHGVLEVAEVVIDAVVVRTEAVTGAREREGPDRGADRRVDRVRHEPHLEDTGRDRDERADDRRDPAHEDAEIPPACEPRFGAIELRGREVEPSAVTLEQRTPAVASDRPADERADEIAERPGKRHD